MHLARIIFEGKYIGDILLLYRHGLVQSEWWNEVRLCHAFMVCKDSPPQSLFYLLKRTRRRCVAGVCVPTGKAHPRSLCAIRHKGLSCTHVKTERSTLETSSGGSSWLLCSMCPRLPKVFQTLEIQKCCSDPSETNQSATGILDNSLHTLCFWCPLLASIIQSHRKRPRKE